MLLWFSSQLQSMILALHSKDSPRQISFAVAIGAVAGWVPFNMIITPILMALLYFLNVNTAFGLLSIAVITIFSFLLDPWAGMLGKIILTDIPFLKPIWTAFFNVPIVPFTQFNNTVVMGSFVIGLLLFIPIYLLSFWAVLRYRAKWQERLEKTKAFKWIKKSKLVTFLLRYKGA